MKYSVLVVVMVLIAKALSYQAVDTTTTIKASTTLKLTTTTPTPVNDCPKGWIYAGPLGCLYFNTDKYENDNTWVQAQGQCEFLGGYLAEATTEEEHEFLKSITFVLEELTGKLQWWIGATDMGHESSWIWEHSEMPLTFESWMPNRPNVKENNQDDCVLMDCKKHHCDWLDVSCTDDVTDHNSNISFICQKSHEEIKTTGTPVTTTPFFPGCESGWQEFENACYKLVRVSRPWTNARDDCLNQESYLASVHSNDEQNFIKTHLTSGISYDVWLGGKMGTFEFEWGDGTDFDYTHWHSGEPNRNGECILMYHSYSMEWVDSACSNNNYYVCKKDYKN